jgi:hypothetical protein
MTEQSAADYINQVAMLLQAGKVRPEDQALVLTGLAQAKATLELVAEIHLGVDVNIDAGRVAELLAMLTSKEPELVSIFESLAKRLSGRQQQK